MALKDHYEFKYAHNSIFLGQSKNKVFTFKMFVDPVGSGVDLVRCMQHDGNI